MTEARDGERLVALVAAAAFAFNYPLLLLFSTGGLLLGIPLLVVYLFVTWLVVIVATALLMERRRAPPRENGTPAQAKASPDD